MTLSEGSEETHRISPLLARKKELISYLTRLKETKKRLEGEERPSQKDMNDLANAAYDLADQARRLPLKGKNRIAAKRILCSAFFFAASWHFQKVAFCLRDGFAKQASIHLKEGISILNDVYSMKILPRRSSALQCRFYSLRKEARYWEKKFNTRLLCPARLSKRQRQILPLIPSACFLAFFWAFTNALPAVLLAVISYIAFYRTLGNREFYKA